MCGGANPNLTGNPYGPTPVSKSMQTPVDYSGMGGSLGVVNPAPQTGGSMSVSAPPPTPFAPPGMTQPPGFSQPPYSSVYQPVVDKNNLSGGQILNPDGSLYIPPGNVNPFGTIGPSSSQAMQAPQTGGGMTIQSQAPQFDPTTGRMALPTTYQSLSQAQPQQQQFGINDSRNPNYDPFASYDPAYRASLQAAQSSLAQPKGITYAERTGTNPLSAQTLPSVGANIPPAFPSQLFGPTAAYIGGMAGVRPAGVPLNYGFTPSTGQWGPPNMQWSPLWGVQPK